MRLELRDLCTCQQICGTILLAPEGINGTIAGTADAIAAILTRLRAVPGCAGLEHKESWAIDRPFQRLKIRLKREIVTMGVPDLDPAREAGIEVAPADWNRLLDDPEVVVIDTRNNFEVAMGSFATALDPGTQSFGDFPAWLAAHRAQLADKKVAMFCTGGIRCEKATSYARRLGLPRVYHLKGGILSYLEQVPADQSRWQGRCFVFDERIALGHGLEIVGDT